jgi:hypothetical protein
MARSWLRLSLVLGLLASGLVSGPAAAAPPASHPRAAESLSGYRSLTPARVLDTRTGLGARKGILAARGRVDLVVLGRGGVPASGVSAVTLNVTATQQPRGGYVTVFPAGATRPLTSTVSFPANRSVANSVTMSVGFEGRVSLYASAQTHLVVDVQGFFATVSGLTGLVPARILDTRIGLGVKMGQLPADGGVNLVVLGVGRVPTEGVSAVLLNVTATQEAASGSVTVFPTGTAKPSPTTSVLSFGPTQSVATGTVAKVGTEGQISLSVSAATHLVVDVQGYFTSGADLTAVVPARVLDTARVLGSDPGLPPSTGALQALGEMDLKVTGVGGVPATGVAAVVLNVTAAPAERGGVLTVFPAGVPKPATSTLNFPPSMVTSNSTVVKVGAGGRVTFAGTARTHLAADVVGYVLNKGEWASVSGGSRSCGVKNDGSAWCWGGELVDREGGGTCQTIGCYSAEPERVPGNNWVSISVSGDVLCGIKTDDSAWCWGSNRHGVLGGGSGTFQPEPVRVYGNHRWMSLDTSDAASAVCGITQDRRGYCWGWGFGNGLGNGTNDEHDAPTPEPLAGTGRWVELTVDLGVGCGLQVDGSAWCWGQVALGQGARTGEYSEPTRAAGSRRWSQLSLGGLGNDEIFGYSVICGIDTSGVTRCWGDNYAGMLGDGTYHPVDDRALTPRTVSGGHRFATVQVSDLAVCALDVANAIWCWGYNKGVFGNGQEHSTGNTPDALVPVPGGFGHLWSTVSRGGARTCGIAVDGSAWCWGREPGSPGSLLPVEILT